LAFACRECLETLPQCRQLGTLPTIATIPIESLLNRVDKILMPKWLGQKLHGPGFHGSHRHRYVAVPSQKDDGN
jgi:hypothetical protein